jgi:crotonobetainyl-CoA:carnitine CoA-transferase CaiB-like acyl-CoA transferase
MQTVDQVVADAQTAALGLIQRFSVSPLHRPLSLVGLPLSFDGIRPPFAKSAPTLGEDNLEILGA